MIPCHDFFLLPFLEEVPLLQPVKWTRGCVQIASSSTFPPPSFSHELLSSVCFFFLLLCCLFPHLLHLPTFLNWPSKQHRKMQKMQPCQENKQAVSQPGSDELQKTVGLGSLASQHHFDLVVWAVCDASAASYWEQNGAVTHMNSACTLLISLFLFSIFSMC